jgi:NDP-sugar pyrophosphorylase family protein
MNRRRALLLAAGRGTRLGALGASTPKCLVPIGPGVLLDRWVNALLESGIDEAVINTHHLRARVKRKIRDINRTTRLHLTESFEPELLGSAGALARNATLCDGANTVVVIYADNASDVSLSSLLDFHDGHGTGATMLLFRAPDPRACGIATLDATRTVTAFVEKPENPSSNLANAGIYAFDRDVYRHIAELAAFDLARDVLPRLVGRMKGFVHTGYHRDIGTPESLARARRDAAAGVLDGAPP